MLQKSTLQFIKELTVNNNRNWFEKNRDRFEDAKSDFLVVAGTMIKGIGKFDPGIAGLEAKNTTFRQYRDVRFSKDKRPYKTNMGAYFNEGGKKINTPGYYLHIEPGNSKVAGGLYEPESVVLAKVRQEIDYDLDEWKKIINSRDFKKHFPGGLNMEHSLTRPPKGYEADNPALPFLKLKSFTVSHPLSDADLITPGLIKRLLESYKSLYPLIRFLTRAIE